MENNTQNNVAIEPSKKSSGLVILIVVIIVLAIVAFIYVRKTNNTPPLTQSEIELNQAVVSDSTTSIKNSLDSINVNDTTIDATNLQSIDKELNNL